MSYLINQSIKNLPTVVSADGIYLDVIEPNSTSSRRIIDGCSGAAVSSVGHNNPEIQEAMAKLSKSHVYTYTGSHSNEASEKLAQFIIENSPKGSFKAATFTCSGSEANENSMKLIRKYHLANNEPKRMKYISRLQSYHGSTIGALSLGDTSRKVGMEPILLQEGYQVLKTSQCYPYRHQKSSETLEDYKNRLLKELEDTFVDNDPETIAGLFIETVTGTNFGCNIPIPGYLDGCKAICEKYGALLVFDEVMCGMGRCGTYHAWETFMESGSGPHIQTIGKAVGAGYVTLAGILVSEKVLDVLLKKGSDSGIMQTYHCHWFNCSVGLEVQKKIKEDGLVANIKEQGTYFGELLKSKLYKYNFVGDIRGVGGFWAIEFVTNRETKAAFDNELQLAYAVKKKMFDNGLQCLGLRGTIDNDKGDHILFCPAFSITKEQVEEMVQIIEKTFEEVSELVK